MSSKSGKSGDAGPSKSIATKRRGQCAFPKRLALKLTWHSQRPLEAYVMFECEESIKELRLSYPRLQDA